MLIVCRLVSQLFCAKYGLSRTGGWPLHESFRSYTWFKLILVETGSIDKHALIIGSFLVGFGANFGINYGFNNNVGLNSLPILSGRQGVATNWNYSSLSSYPSYLPYEGYSFYAPLSHGYGNSWMSSAYGAPNFFDYNTTNFLSYNVPSYFSPYTGAVGPIISVPALPQKPQQQAVSFLPQECSCDRACFTRGTDLCCADISSQCQVYSKSPTASPTLSPTVSPTTSPTVSPSRSPTISPTASPKLYALGPDNTVEYFDGVIWKAAASLGTACCSLSTVVYGGMLYAVGEHAKPCSVHFKSKP